MTTEELGPGKPLKLSLYTGNAGDEVAPIAWYGLPSDVVFCVACNMSNQQPMSCNEYRHGSGSQKTTMSFGEDGLCNACRFNRLKHDGTIDWQEREQELKALCDLRPRAAQGRALRLHCGW